MSGSENYYDLLGVDPSASEDEIRQAIKEKTRIWVRKQNAPMPEQRQQAEHCLRLLPLMEEVLFDAGRRAEYDRNLQAPARQQGDRQASGTPQSGSTLDEAKRLFGQGRVADALYVAQQVTREDPDNADAWAFLGICRHEWGDAEEALADFRRATSERPNDAALYYILASAHEDLGHWDEALKQYQRAVQLAPQVTAFRAALGSLLIQGNAYNEGVTFLEQCVSAEPENEGYKQLLGLAYIDMAHRGWTYVQGRNDLSTGFYATSEGQLESAEAYANAVDALGIDDPTVQNRLSALRADITRMRTRTFRGSKVAILFALLIALILLNTNSYPSLGAVYFLSCIAYPFACRTQRYSINRHAVAGQPRDMLSKIVETGGREGCAGYLVGAFISAMLLPAVTVLSAMMNYPLWKPTSRP